MNMQEKSQEQQYVWYACYGSNLLEARFLCYIEGGEFMGKSYTGCSNKALPIKEDKIIIPHDLYFAKQSPRWGDGGVAFITRKKSAHKQAQTLGKMYLITQAQFEAVAKQEGGWYSPIELGTKDDIPILSLTSPEYIVEAVPPSLDYLKTVVRGFIETYPHFYEKAVASYFMFKQGIENHYSLHDLIKIIRPILKENEAKYFGK